MEDILSNEILKYIYVVKGRRHPQHKCQLITSLTKLLQAFNHYILEYHSQMSTITIPKTIEELTVAGCWAKRDVAAETKKQGLSALAKVAKVLTIYEM
jgi:hypothetical protein